MKWASQACEALMAFGWHCNLSGARKTSQAYRHTLGRACTKFPKGLRETARL